MAKRRTAADALTSEQQQFINAGRAKPVAPEPADEPERPTEQLGVRITPSLMQSLRQAQADRSVKRRAPWRIQDIVAAALRDWFDANDYSAS